MRTNNQDLMHICIDSKVFPANNYKDLFLLLRSVEDEPNQVYIDLVDKKIKMDTDEEIEQQDMLLCRDPERCYIPIGEELCSYHEALSAYEEACEDVEIPSAPARYLREAGLYDDFRAFQYNMCLKRFIKWFDERNFVVDFGSEN